MGAALARRLAARGVRPNAVSVAGVGFALVSAAAFYSFARAGTWRARRSSCWPPPRASSCGCCAICSTACSRSKKGSRAPTGEIFNDLPDRVADVLILVGAGYAVRQLAHGATLGWAAAVAAVFTAYVRVLGGSLGLTQHFIGPMAKQHRMFTLTVAALLAAVEALLDLPVARDSRRPRRHRRGIGRDRNAAHPAHPGRGQGAMIATALASACRLISGATVEWRCDPYADAQRIYFANHSSHLDFIVIWSALPPTAAGVHPPGRRTRLLGTRRHPPLSRRPGVPRGAGRSRQQRRLGRCRGSPRVRRSSGWRRRWAHRDSLIVFPEGTRSADGEIGPVQERPLPSVAREAGRRADPGPPGEPESDSAEG